MRNTPKNRHNSYVTFPTGTHDRAIEKAQKAIDSIVVGSRIYFRERYYEVYGVTDSVVYMLRNGKTAFLNKASILDALLNKRIGLIKPKDQGLSKTI